ncbi:MAG: NAD(P)H-hydrate dehydratase [Rudaea sp.]
MNSRLYTAAQVRELDRRAIESLAIPGATLMQRAAAAAWRVLRERWPQARSIAVLCGSGNNGGDGYLLACLARQASLDVRLIALGEPKPDGDAARARSDWHAAGGAIVNADGALDDSRWSQADVVVDALFGTGLARPPEGIAHALIERINVSDYLVLALDVPSGIDADTGAVLGVAVRAKVTVTFVAHKRGLITGAALDHCGELVLDRLDLPDTLFADAPFDARQLDMRRMNDWLPPRPRDSNKGRYGHVLAIGGDAGMGGAIRLCAEGALRAGAGLVSAATRAQNVIALNAGRPEIMAHAASDAESIEGLLDRASVVAIGPGLGRGEWSQALWRAALASNKPLVVDADALNLLVGESVTLPPASVMTPHPGEAARLLGCAAAQIQRNRYAAVRELAQRYRAVAVLKGAGTLIADPQGAVAVCPWGNPGMASGGMGDVLTGVVAGLLAQGLNPWRAARLGVALHARAGDAVARDGAAGMLASDLFPHLRRLRNVADAND